MEIPATCQHAGFQLLFQTTEGQLVFQRRSHTDDIRISKARDWQVVSVYLKPMRRFAVAARGLRRKERYFLMDLTRP